MKITQKDELNSIIEPLLYEHLKENDTFTMFDDDIVRFKTAKGYVAFHHHHEYTTPGKFCIRTYTTDDTHIFDNNKVKIIDVDMQWRHK